MEGIKGNFDKIMEEFDDVTHSAPKKLCFLKLEDASFSKKRRVSDREDSTGSRPSDSPKHNSGDSSIHNRSIPMSPFEKRHLEANLGEAKSRILQLEYEMEQMQKIHRKENIFNEQKIHALKEQCEFASQKVTEFEKHLKTIRKREFEAKQRSLEIERDAKEQKIQLEQTINQLDSDKNKILNLARQTEHELTRQLNQYRYQSEELEVKLRIQSEEVDVLQQKLEDLKKRAADYEEIKSKYEKADHDLKSANSRVEELELKLAEYNDWKEITKSSQERFVSINEKEKELEYLRSQTKKLKQLVENKMFLEAQVISMEPAVQREETTRNEMIALQAKLFTVEKELKDWIQVAQDHCLPNELVNPLALRKRIEDLLKTNISSVSEKNDIEIKMKDMESQLLDHKHKVEIYSKNIEDLNKALRRHKEFKERVQKKLLLVCKERDCYKQLLESFDKEMTISNMSSTEMSSLEQQIRLRLDMLEKTIQGYKEMCASLEKELVNARHLPSNDLALESAMSTEGYEGLRKEIDSLRIENERILRKKQELELELEHRCLKGDFSTKDYKVLHMKSNPADEAYQESANLIEKLQAEKERLKRRIKQLEEDNEATQQRFNETSSMTLNIKEMNQLRSELESTNQKMKVMKEAYKSASMEFREVCYMLFGYRVDRIGGSANYKISSMYAESPDQYMNFRLNEDSVLELLETPYSTTLQAFMEQHLVGNASLPVFLSALTLDLFQRSTITIQ